MIQNSGDILSIIEKLKNVDLMDLKPLYPQLIKPLNDKLRNLPKGTNKYYQCLALQFNIIEEGLFTEELR